MPVYKHVAASQKRTKRKAEQLLSDEEDDLSASGSDASDASQDEAASDDEDDSDEDDSAEEDDGLGGADDEVLGEDDPRPPPKGFPTALEALENQVVSSALLVAQDESDDSGDEGEKEGEGEGEDEEELPLVCVVCPNKVLKKGKMTEVHLASKDHKRRLARFAAHVQSDDFPAEFAHSDARWFSSQLDKAVIERLSMQTLVGGKKAGTAPAAAAKEEAEVGAKQPDTPAKKGKGKEKEKVVATPSKSDAAAGPSSAEGATPTKPSNAQRKAEAVAVAEKEGISVREQLRRAKKEKQAKRLQRKKEKNERIKRRKVEKGEEIPARPPAKRFVEKVKPTEEEIAARQAWKKARDEAKAAGKPVPPRPVLAYEHGGKVPARVIKQHEQKAKAFEQKQAAGESGEKKKVRKERRKSAAGAKKGEDEVLAEV